MTFDSYRFLLLFAPLAIGVYWLLPAGRARQAWLTAAGFALYATFDWRWLPLLALAIVVAHVAGRRVWVAEGPARRRWLVAGIVVALLPLAVYKLHGLARSGDGVAGLVLPVGLSFFTFQSLTYALDLYHRRAEPASGMLHVAAFTSFFPTLLAGPIARWQKLGKDLAAPAGRLDLERVNEGLALLVLGLAQKTLIADPLERHVVAPHAAAAGDGLWIAWLVALGYTARLYFDFAGYSDMAAGLARLLGLEVPRNFALPYQARNIQQFWDRWHISLSSWFRDYLFFPTSRALLLRGGSRHPDLTRAASYVLTMGLIGLWHGATPSFVAWGLFHAALLVVYFLARRPRGKDWGRLGRPLTFVAVVFGWVLFRSATLGGALGEWSALVGLRGVEPLAEVLARVGWGPIVFTLAATAWLLAGTDAWARPLPRTRAFAVALGVAAAVALGMLAAPAPFVYFQF